MVNIYRVYHWGRDVNWAGTCAAVIPCYNEAKSIGELVAGVRRHLPNVIVVDDGSSDETAKLANKAGAAVIRLPRNTGKGAALRAGWELAHNRRFTWALNLDGDGQHAPEDIPKFFERAECTRAVMIVGNRMDCTEGMPRVRRWVNRWMSRRLSRLAGVPLPDCQCGFRLLNLDVVTSLLPTTNHFEIESELVVDFVAAGRRVEFVPIRVIYKSHASKIHPLVDGWRWARWWFAQRRRMQDNQLAVRLRMNNLAQPHA